MGLCNKMFIFGVALFLNDVHADTVFQKGGAALLGQGYSTNKEVKLQNICFKGDSKYVDSQESELKLKLEQNVDKLYTDLGIKSGAKFTIEILSASGSSDFFASITDNDLSFKNNFVFDVNAKSYGLFNLELSQRGIEILTDAMGTTNPSKYFYDACGDHVVTEVKLSGKVIVSVSFDFDDTKVKTHFKQNAKISFADLISANSEVQAKLDLYKRKLKIRISAKQIGGNPNRLDEVLNSAGFNGASPTECGVESPEAMQKCIQYYKQIEKYIANPERGFIAQLEDLSYNPSSPYGPATVGFNVSYIKGLRVPQLTMLEPQNFASLQVQEAKQKLIEKYISQTKHNYTVDYLLTRSDLTDEERATFEEINRSIDKNRLVLQSALETCQRDIFNCTRVALETELKLAQFDPSLLQKEFLFVDYCKYPENQSYTNDTVEAILSNLFLQLSNDIELENLEDCDYLNEFVVKNQESLRLVHPEGKRLHDLRPLKGFENLKKLDLSNNHVMNLNFLEDLPNLEELILRENILQNLRGIGRAKQLNYLDASFNNIDDIMKLDPLLNLSKLETLRLYGNDDDELSQLSPYSNFGDDLDKQDINDFVTSIDNRILTGKQLCHIEREWLHNTGRIDYSVYVQLLSLDGFFSYETPQNPDNSLIRDEVVLCTPNENYYFIVERDSWKVELPADVQ